MYTLKHIHNEKYLPQTAARSAGYLVNYGKGNFSVQELDCHLEAYQGFLLVN